MSSGEIIFLVVAILVVIALSWYFKAQKKDGDLLCNKKDSPLYNWHLADDLGQGEIIPWDQVFRYSRLISNYRDVAQIAEEYKMSVNEVKEDLIIVFYHHSPAPLVGMGGYLYIWKNQKKQFKFEQTIIH